MIEVGPAAQRLADELKRLRQSTGVDGTRPLSQQQLGACVGQAAKSAISDFETGSRIPQVETLDAYAAKFDLDPQDLRDLRAAALKEQAPHRTTGTGHPKRRHLRPPSSKRTRIGLVAGTVAIGLAAVLTVVLLATTSGPGTVQRSRLISGSVTCGDGATVEGVWIEAVGGKSDFSQTVGSGSHKRFTFQLEGTDRWTVHVGCGGSEADWLQRPDGNVTTTAINADWICAPPRRPQECHLTPG